MHIVLLEQVEQIIPLLQQSHETPFRFLRREIPGELGTFWFDQIAGSVEGEKGKIFAAVQDSRLLGILVYNDLPWDSRVLGYQMGAIKFLVCDPTVDHRAEVARRLLNHVEQQALADGTEFLLCKVYSNDMFVIHALEKQGFYLVDTLLDYGYDLRRYPLQDIPAPPGLPGSTVREAKDSDLPILVELAEKSFQGHFGRYHTDQRIGRDKATTVYKEWIKSSFGGYADWIVVAEVDNQIVGVSTWKKPSAMEQTLSVVVGHFNIAATHPDFAGHGIFKSVTRAGMELISGHCHYIDGPTHINNYPVQRGFAKLGWHIADARHSFHKWLRE